MKDEVFPKTGYLKTSERIASSFHRSRIIKGDLVVAIRATLGKGMLVPEFLDGANLTQGTAKVSPGPKLNSQYLFWSFNSKYVQTEIDLNAKGTIFREITLEKLRQIKIALPPLEEQIELSSQIEEISSKISRAIRCKEKEIEKLKEYKGTLINSAVTGKIQIN